MMHGMMKFGNQYLHEKAPRASREQDGQHKTPDGGSAVSESQMGGYSYSGGSPGKIKKHMKAKNVGKGDHEYPKS